MKFNTTVIYFNNDIHVAGKKVAIGILIILMILLRAKSWVTFLRGSLNSCFNKLSFCYYDDCLPTTLHHDFYPKQRNTEASRLQKNRHHLQIQQKTSTSSATRHSRLCPKSWWDISSRQRAVFQAPRCRVATHRCVTQAQVLFMQRNAREGSPLPFSGSSQNIKKRKEPDTAVKYQWQFKKVVFLWFWQNIIEESANFHKATKC